MTRADGPYDELAWIRADAVEEGWDLARIDREMRGVRDTLREHSRILSHGDVTLLVRELRTLRALRREVAANTRPAPEKA